MIKTSYNQTEIRFGYGDILVNILANKETGEPVGIGLQSTPANTIGMTVGPGDRTADDCFLLMFFDKEESLDVVLRQLNCLKKQIVEYKNNKS